MINDCQENPFCSSLNDEIRGRLCKSCIRIHLQPKQELQIKQPPRQIVIVTSGMVNSVLTLEDGDRRSVELFRSGNLIGVTRLFVKEKIRLAEAYIEAITEVELGLIPTEVFHTLLQQNTEVCLAVLTSVSIRLHDALWYGNAIKSYTSEEKIRSVVEYLENEKVDTSNLTHEELGLLADMNRVTVTRAMKNIYNPEQHNKIN